MSSGYELGVDLYELWHAGRNLLPQVAEQFTEASGSLDGASARSASWRGGGLGSGGSHGAGVEIDALRDTLDGFLTKTHRNLNQVGQALVEAANDYDRTDDEARAEFERRKQAMGE